MPGQDPLLPFGEYRPDIVDYDGISSQLITNVVPRGDGYGPHPDLSAFTKTLPAACRGAFSAQKADGSIVTFAGTATKLYQLNNTDFSWVDVSRSGGTYTALNVTSNWHFVQFGNLVFATQANDLLQVFNIQTPSTNFSNNSGSPPQAAYVIVVGQFLVLLGLLSLPFREQWSGIGDTTNWTAGVGQSDFQDFADGGILTGGAGGEYGVIFQTKTIRQMTYAPGSSYIFQFTRICEDQGLIVPDALVRAASKIIFYSAQGFQLLVPGALPIPIGKEKIDRSFAVDWDSSQPQLFVGSNDPNSTRAYFSYKSVNGPSLLADTLLIYDYVLERWVPVHGMNGNNGIEYLLTATKSGITLEALDVAATTTIAITGADGTASGNLLQRSNDFTNAFWSNANSTLTPNSGTSPDGTNDAWKWQRNSTAGANIQVTIAKPASPLTYTFSIHAKLASGANPQYLGLYVDDGGGTNRVQATFNLATGIISRSPVNDGNFTNISAAIQFVPAGSFYRCTITFTTNSAALLRVAFNGNSNNGLLLDVDSVTTAILVFGAQVEQLSFAAAYLPTVAATSIRTRLTVATVNLPVLTLPVDGAPSPTTLQTGAFVNIWNVGGTTDANGENQVITVIDSTHIELQAVPFVHAYTRGGVIVGPLDAMTLSLDSYSTSVLPALAAFNNSHMLGFFNGSNLGAKLESSEHGNHGQRLMTGWGFRPVTDAPGTFGSIGGRETLQATRVYTAEQASNVAGLMPIRISARYIRGRLRVPAGTSWTYAMGIEPEGVRPNGKR